MAECTVPTCPRPAGGRGLCYPHYSVWYRRNHATVRTCTVCGAEFDARRPQTRVCSRACHSSAANGARKASFALRANGRLPVVFSGPRMVSDVPSAHPSRSQRFSSGRVFVSGGCKWCGEQFTIIDQLTARFCSARCSKNAQRAERDRRFRIAPKVRQSIYERDGWVCQLCDGPVDPSLHYSDDWAASLDHIECQSWVLVPDHSPENLRLSHRWCNSVRGDESYYTEADLHGPARVA